MLHDGVLRNLVKGFQLNCGVLIQELLEIFLPSGTDTHIVLQQGLSIFGSERV